jgi:LysM repeat protein
MAQDLGSITTSQTFQNWFNKTNEIVELLATNVVTAAPGGSTTPGSATLTGNFTAANVIGSTKISTDTIEAVTGSAPVNVNGAFKVTGTSQLTTTFENSAGAQTRYTNGSLSWDVGLENSNPGNFIINTGVTPNKFSLSTAGTLTVPNLAITENANVTGTLTVGSLSIGPGGAGLSTDDVSEGTSNLYHTTARVRAAVTGGDGINVNSATGVISFDGQGELDSYQGNKFITTGSVGSGDEAYMSGKQVSGSPFGGLYAKTAGVIVESFYWSGTGAGINGALQVSGNIETTTGSLLVKSGGSVKASIDQSGNGYFHGDVTTNGSASDERLKENIVPLDKGLETIEQIKTYTFNYKNRPQDTHPGVIAQEIEELVPEVVYDIEMEDGTYKAVRYQQLVPLLINAIKDLSEKVNVLENKLINKE